MKPELLFDRFREISAVPRESGNEAGMTAYLLQFAADRGLEYRTDANGNVVIVVPGRGTGVNSDTIILQSHTDMVCVKAPGSTHDFTKDAIQLRVEERMENGTLQPVLLGTDTTLGADNGMGVAASLAAAEDPSIKNCPPLELLFTVDEERGLTGAGQLDPSLITGTYLINMDSEELGEICISCAGGRDMTAVWQTTRSAAPDGWSPLTVSLTGLPGGPSGVQINEGRGNAIAMLLGAITAAAGTDEVRLSSLTGGSKRNVIPSTCEVTLWAEAAVARRIADVLGSSEQLDAFKAALHIGAELVKVTVTTPEAATAGEPIGAAETSTLLAAILAVPWGPQAMSAAVPGLVETSNNVAVISTTENAITLSCSTRSSAQGAIEAFQDIHRPALQSSGATVTHSDGYPGWEADRENPLLTTAQGVFEQVLGYAPKVMAIHAGLECGVLKGVVPRLRMISFGPDIRDAHTILERVLLNSVPPFYQCLVGLLGELAG